MSSTFEIRTTSRVWEGKPLKSQSNAGNELVVEMAMLPEEALAEGLLQRLIQRSTSPEGFDREILRNLNETAWGTQED